MSANLIAMSGPENMSLADLSNFEAGLAMLGVINQVYPGIRFSQLPELAEGAGVEKMGWSWNPMDAVRAVQKTAGNLKDGIGDVLKDTFTTVGGGYGDAVRLATDENVLDGASKMYAAYMTGGGSELMDFVTNLGATAKEKTAAASAALPGGVLPWALGGGGLLIVMMMMAGRR